MRQHIQNERGSMAILTVWTLTIVAIMLILVVNIAKLYVVKEQAALAAEQASIAASSVVVEEVKQVVDHYIDPDAPPGAKTLKEKVTEQRNMLIGHHGMTASEAYVEALNVVLPQEATYDSDLRDELVDAMNSAVYRMPSVVGNIITENHGKRSDTTIYVLNSQQRIEVETTVRFEKSHYSGMHLGQDEDVPQKGMGPELRFVSSLPWSSPPIQLP